MRSVARWLVGCLCACAVLGCEAVIGLRDYSFADAGRPLGDDPQAVAGQEPGVRDAGPLGTGSAVAIDKSARCRQFCEHTSRTCPAAPDGESAQDYQIYATAEECQAACELLTPGQIQCRDDQVRYAEQNTEYYAHCQAASLGGSTACGGNCENYCALIDSVCTGENRDPAQANNCVSKCKALHDWERGSPGLPATTSRYGVTRDATGDTLQCRLVHLTLAASADRADEQCWQAWLSPRSGPDGAPNPCSASTPNCADYCQIAVNGCSGEHQIYENMPQCAAVCAVFEPGTVGALKGNTIGCRTAHAYNGLISDPVHCTHAGPGGAGACGDDCTSYCRMLQVGCERRFGEQYGTAPDPLEACQTTCRTTQGDDWIAYSTGLASDPTSPTLACRLLFAARALEKPQQSAELCESAAGGAECQR